MLNPQIDAVNGERRPQAALVITDAEFGRQLEVFRTETAAATQYFYAYLAVHAVAADHRAVQRFLNLAPTFWNTNLSALQTSAFIALGRVFDQDKKSKHNVDKLLRSAQDNPQLFTKSALSVRKQGDNASPPDWLPGYLRDKHVPVAADFRRLRGHVRRYRKIYETNYRDVRNTFFAHMAVSDRTEVATLFAKTNIREFQRVLVFLSSLHDALWELFNNGRKPVLRPRRYSVKRMRDAPSPLGRPKAVQESITLEVDKFLCTASNVTKSRSGRHVS